MREEKYDALVGIFMPAYNQGKYIDETLESLKAQTFQDFLVHIVDDGSDDLMTTEKLKTINYEKAKVFLNVSNKGVAFRARQHYDMLNTKYIMVLCADDIIAPDFLEKTVGFLEKNAKYGAVSTNIKLFWDNINECYAEKHYNDKEMVLPEVLARNRVLGSSLMRAKALKETDLSGGFTRYQDWDRWISMLEAGWKIGLVPEFLFYYRQTPSSLSHSASVEDELDIRQKLLKKHSKSYEKYHDEVILDMERAFLEMQEGKNWLDEQYFKLNNEIERLSKENEELRAVAEKRRVNKIANAARKIKRLIKK